MTYEEIDWTDINKYQSIHSLPCEVWRDLPEIRSKTGTDIDYQVSDYGRVRRKDTSFVYKIGDNGAGYKKVAITKKGTKGVVNFYIHRLVASTFLPNPNNLPQVNHKRIGLGKFDNRVKHLEWCTERDNIIDAHDNGQMDNRTRVNTSIDIKSDDFVAKMYWRYKETGAVGETAREFGVSRTTLSSIVNKRSRVKITDKIDKEFEVPQK